MFVPRGGVILTSGIPMVAQIKTDNGVTPRQEKAIIALCTEPSVQRAADSLQMPMRTLYRWMQEEAFKAALRRARRDSFTQAIALCQRYSSLAVTTLAKVMADSSAPHHAKVSAASAMLKFGRESLELDDLAQRIGVLEQAAAQGNEQSSKWGSHHASHN